MRTFSSFVISLVCVAFIAEASYFIHLSDPHVDFEYTPGTPTDCLLRKEGFPCCHTLFTNITPCELAPRFGHWKCDAPRELIVDAVTEFAKLYPEPKFIVVTGDIVSHNALHETSKEIAAKWDWFFTLLEKNFGSNVKIIATLGNHDVFLADQYPDNKTAEVVQFLTPVMKAHRLIRDNNEDEMMFAKYGFYKTDLEGTNLEFISTNTIIDLHQNAQTDPNLQDPMNQYQYIKELMKDARKNGRRVWMISHLMPNNTQIRTRGATSYTNLVDEFSPDVLQVGLFGHTHHDHFGLVGKLKMDSDAKSLAIMCPGMTPKAGIYTSLRAVDITDDFQITDWHQYYVNIAKANKNDKVVVEHVYDLKKEYDLPEFSTQAFQDLARNLLRNETLATRFISHFHTRGGHASSCDTGCRSNLFCGVSFMFHDFYVRCTGMTYEQLLEL